MDNIKQIVAQTPLFGTLEPDQLDRLLAIAVEKKYGKNEIVFSEGDEGNGFYVIVEGQVKIFKVSLDGKEKILHIFGLGEPFGEIPVFVGQSFPANAQTISKSHLLFFPRIKFIELVTRHPTLALSMLAILSTRLRQFTVQIENLTLKEVPGRLAAYLVYTAEEQGTRDRVTLKISKGQLASLLGTIPETLSRIFAKMSSQNLVEVNGRKIKLLKRSALEELAEHGKEME